MTLQFPDEPAAHWHTSQNQAALPVTAQAERVGAPFSPAAIQAGGAGRGHRRAMALMAISLLLGTGGLLSGCVAAADYDPPAYVDQFDYPYPAYGAFDFDYWGGRDWHHHDWDHDHDDHGHGEHGH